MNSAGEQYPTHTIRKAEEATYEEEDLSFLRVLDERTKERVLFEHFAVVKTQKEISGAENEAKEEVKFISKFQRDQVHLQQGAPSKTRSLANEDSKTFSTVNIKFPEKSKGSLRQSLFFTSSEKLHTATESLYEYGYDNFQYLGEGSFGFVVKAMNKKRNEWVALKVLELGSSSTGDQFSKVREKEYKKEASYLYEYSKLLSENFTGKSLKIFQKLVIEDAESRYLVLEMELAEKNLQQIIQERSLNNLPFSYEEKLAICSDLLQGLFYLHQQNISHFDIKPENIFYISDVDSYVLADFGICEKIDTNSPFLEISKNSVLYPSGVQGTPKYMSPKVKRAFLNGQHTVTHDPFKSDVYSLGIVFLEIITTGIVSHVSFGDQIRNRKKLEELIAEFPLYFFKVNLSSLTQGEHIYVKNGCCLHKLCNILELMLVEDEILRENIFMLCSICNIQSCFSTIVATPFLNVFKPSIEEVKPRFNRIKYTAKPVLYEGELNPNMERSGFGELSRIEDKTGRSTIKRRLYRGRWLNDFPDGRGELIISDLYRYSGVFKKGEKHGYGRFSIKNSILEEGLWVRNQPPSLNLFFFDCIVDIFKYFDEKASGVLIPYDIFENVKGLIWKSSHLSGVDGELLLFVPFSDYSYESQNSILRKIKECIYYDREIKESVDKFIVIRTSKSKLETLLTFKFINNKRCFMLTVQLKEEEEDRVSSLFLDISLNIKSRYLGLYLSDAWELNISMKSFYLLTIKIFLDCATVEKPELAIDFSNTFFSDEEIAKLLNDIYGKSKLVHLNLANLKLGSSSFRDALVRTGNDLQTLILSQNRLMSKEDIARVMEKLRNLKSIDISGCVNSLKYNYNILKFESISHVSVPKFPSQIESAVINDLPLNCNFFERKISANIINLSLRKCLVAQESYSKTKVILSISQSKLCANLRSLDLSFNQLSNANLEPFFLYSKIELTQFFLENNIEINDEFFKGVKYRRPDFLKEIRNLNLGFTSITELSIDCIEDIKSDSSTPLEILSLAGCFKVNIHFIAEFLMRDTLGVTHLCVDGLYMFIDSLKSCEGSTRFENDTVREIKLVLNIKENGETYKDMIWFIRNIKTMFLNIENLCIDERFLSPDAILTDLGKIDVLINNRPIFKTQNPNLESQNKFFNMEKMLARFEEKRAFSSYFKMDDEVLKTMAQLPSFGEVEEMNLNACVGVTDIGFRYILKQESIIFKGLLIIKLRHTQITISSLYKLIENQEFFKKLRNIDIFCCSAIAPEELRDFFIFMQNSDGMNEEESISFEMIYKSPSDVRVAKFLLANRKRWITDYFETKSAFDVELTATKHRQYLKMAIFKDFTSVSVDELLLVVKSIHEDLPLFLRSFKSNDIRLEKLYFEEKPYFSKNLITGITFFVDHKPLNFSLSYQGSATESHFLGLFEANTFWNYPECFISYRFLHPRKEEPIFKSSYLRGVSLSPSLIELSLVSSIDEKIWKTLGAFCLNLDNLSSRTKEYKENLPVIIRNLGSLSHLDLSLRNNLLRRSELQEIFADVSTWINQLKFLKMDLSSNNIFYYTTNKLSRSISHIKTNSTQIMEKMDLRKSISNYLYGEEKQKPKRSYEFDAKESHHPLNIMISNAEQLQSLNLNLSKNYVLESHISKLCRSLCWSESLAKLKLILSFNKLLSNTIQKLLSLVKGFPHLKTLHLDFEGNNLSGYEDKGMAESGLNLSSLVKLHLNFSLNDINYDVIPHVNDFIRPLHDLTELKFDLGIEKLGDSSALKEFHNNLYQKCYLEKLSLALSDPREMITWGSGLKEHEKPLFIPKFLKVLKLKLCDFFNFFSDSIKFPEQTRFLDLDCRKVACTHISVCFIFNRIAELCNLEGLNLKLESHKLMTETDLIAEAFSRILKGNRKIWELKLCLRDFAFKSMSANVLLEELNHLNLQSLTLKLRGDILDTQNFKVLGKILDKMQSLAFLKLGLSEGEVTDEKLSYISNGLQNVSSLKALIIDLGINMIGYKGAKAFFVSLRSMKQLSILNLDLRLNPLENAEPDLFDQNISALNNLSELVLNLESTAISHECLLALSDCLMCLYQLRILKINIGGNNQPQSAEIPVFRHLKYTKNITTLKLEMINMKGRLSNVMIKEIDFNNLQRLSKLGLNLSYNELNKSNVLLGIERAMRNLGILSEFKLILRTCFMSQKEASVLSDILGNLKNLKYLYLDIRENLLGKHLKQLSPFFYKLKCLKKFVLLASGNNFLKEGTLLLASCIYYMNNLTNLSLNLSYNSIDKDSMISLVTTLCQIEGLSHMDIDIGGNMKNLAEEAVAKGEGNSIMKIKGKTGEIY